MRMKKILGIILSAGILFTAVPAANISHAEEDNILYYEDFEGDTALDSNAWNYANHGNVSDGELKIAAGKYPLLKLPDTDSEKAYEFSYKIKFEGTGGIWKIYDNTSGYQIAFGAAKPEKGFYWKSLNGVDIDESHHYGGEINKWYTVKIGFSTGSEHRYTEWTLLDENGTVINSQKENGMFVGADDMSMIPAEKSVKIKDIYFWNVGINGNVCIDDITLKEIPMPNPEPDEPELPEGVVFEEKFDVGSIAELLSNGNGWRKNSNTDISDGTLKIPEGAYIYFDVKKNNDCIYKASYDIMAPETGGGGGGFNFVTGGATPWSLGYFNTKNGFAGIKRTYDDSSCVISGMEAGKWYTVEVTFYEKGLDGFIKYTVTDRETQRELGTIEPSYFQAEDTGDAVAENTTEFFVWNRDSSGETYYIDNIKFENMGQKPEFNADKTVFIDYADNQITDLSKEITPGIKSIVLDFSTEVTEESADAGIRLTDYSQSADGVDVSINKTADGTKYILSLDECLKENTNYAVKISKSVQTESGEQLSSGHTVGFKTGKREVKLDVDGIYTGNVKHESIETISANGKLNVKASLVNATQNDGKCVICVSYFNGNRMVSTSLKTVAFSANSGVKLNEEFTAPADMTDIDSMQIVFWNDAADMMIYSNAVTLRK